MGGSDGHRLALEPAPEVGQLAFFRLEGGLNRIGVKAVGHGSRLGVDVQRCLEDTL